MQPHIKESFDSKVLSPSLGFVCMHVFLYLRRFLFLRYIILNIPLEFNIIFHPSRSQSGIYLILHSWQHKREGASSFINNSIEICIIF